MLTTPARQRAESDAGSVEDNVGSTKKPRRAKTPRAPLTSKQKRRYFETIVRKEKLPLVFHLGKPLLEVAEFAGSNRDKATDRFVGERTTEKSKTQLTVGLLQIASFARLATSRSV
jgi:hypothetical protein